MCPFHISPLTFQEAGPKTRQTAGRRFKVTLGIMPDVVGSDSRGLPPQSGIPGKPGAHAGLKKEDIIVAMDGKRANDIYEYMARLSDFETGQRITLDVMWNGEKIILIVHL